MKLYADYPGRAARQVLADLLAVVLIVLAVLAGVTVHGLISAFGTVGTQLEDSGEGFQETMEQVGDNLGGVPVIGPGIRGPFDSASGAGVALADAGRTVHDVVETLAVASGVLVALGPILIVLALWLIPRVRFVRRATEARALGRSADGAELLALRALTRQPIRQLTAIDARPLEAWRARDERAVRALAQLELKTAGVRLG
jgi:hypothetical protein